MKIGSITKYFENKNSGGLRWAYTLKSGFFRLLIKGTPVKKNKFVFTSFNGHYSDSPKYISEAIHELNPDIEIVWLVCPQYKHLVPDYAKVEIIGGIRATLQIARASVRVDNVYADQVNTLTGDGILHKFKFKILNWLIKKKGLHIYTTWHGTPLKRMGKHLHGNTILDFSCDNITMILDNAYTLNIMEDLCFHKLQMKLLGMPRNDLLYAGDECKKLEWKEVLGLPTDKKVVLFAPTFRSDGDGVSDKNIYRSGLDQLKAMNISKLLLTLKEQFGGEWVFVCRFHYHVEQMVDWKELEQKYPNQIFNGNSHDDMAQYLASTDVLITDASSSMFDYSLTNRPCFLYFPDLKYYKEKERGFYCDIEELPFSVTETFDGLLQNIRSFDEKEYVENVKRMQVAFGYVQEKEAAKKVAAFILDEHEKRQR